MWIKMLQSFCKSPAQVFIPMRQTPRTKLDQLLIAILKNYDDDESVHLFEDMGEGKGKSYAKRVFL